MGRSGKAIRWMLVTLALVAGAYGIAWATTTYSGSSSYSTSITIPVDKQDRMTAKSITDVLKVLLDNDVYLNSQVTSSKGGSVPRVTADGIASMGTYYELQTIEGERYLRPKRFVNFSRVARTVGAADSEYNWTWVNRANLGATNDEDTTTNDALRLQHGAGATQYTAATKTAPYRYKLFQSVNSTPIRIISRVTNNANVNGEVSGIIAIQDNNTNNWAAIWYGQFTGNPGIECWDGASNIVAVTETTVWVMLVIDGTSSACLYSESTSSTPPTSWTWLADSATEFDLGTPLRIGQITTGGGALNADWLYYADNAYAEADVGINPTWGAQGYDSSAAEIQILTDWDMGSAAPALNQTQIRNAFVDAVNRLPDDAATWTFSVKQSATAGATSGSFQAAASITVSGTGRYVSVWAKASSSGNTQAGSLKLPITLPFTPS